VRLLFVANNNMDGGSANNVGIDIAQEPCTGRPLPAPELRRRLYRRPLA
jgi:hypothetical protein